MLFFVFKLIFSHLLNEIRIDFSFHLFLVCLTDVLKWIFLIFIQYQCWIHRHLIERICLRIYSFHSFFVSHWTSCMLMWVHFFSSTSFKNISISLIISQCFHFVSTEFFHLLNFIHFSMSSDVRENEQMLYNYFI